MCTHVPGFQSFFRLFASFCIGQISYQQHKGYIWPFLGEKDPKASRMMTVMVYWPLTERRRGTIRGKGTVVLSFQGGRTQERQSGLKNIPQVMAIIRETTGE